MESINAGLAVIVILGGLLCARAFIPHVSIFGKRPVDNLARGLTLCALGSFPRVTFWDVMYGYIGLQSPIGIATNLVFNVMLVIGVYFVLRARLMTIPDNERPLYNIFTAPFYPQNIFPRLRDKE